MRNELLSRLLNRPDTVNKAVRLNKPVGLDTSPLSIEGSMEIPYEGSSIIIPSDSAFTQGSEVSTRLATEIPLGATYLGEYTPRNIRNKAFKKMIKATSGCVLGRYGEEIVDNLPLYNGPAIKLIAFDYSSLGIFPREEEIMPMVDLSELLNRVNKVADLVPPEVSIDLAIAYMQKRISLEDKLHILNSLPIAIPDSFDQIPGIWPDKTRIILHGRPAFPFYHLMNSDAIIVAALREN